MIKEKQRWFIKLNITEFSPNPINYNNRPPSMIHHSTSYDRYFVLVIPMLSYRGAVIKNTQKTHITQVKKIKSKKYLA